MHELKDMSAAFYFHLAAGALDLSRVRLGKLHVIMIWDDARMAHVNVCNSRSEVVIGEKFHSWIFYAEIGEFLSFHSDF